MKKYIFTLLCLLCINNVFAQEAPIKFVSCSPGEGAKLTTIHKLTLTFDLSNVYAYYPKTPKEEFGIKAQMTTSTKFSTFARNIRLYKAEDTPASDNIVALCRKAADFVANSNTIEVEFDAPIILTPGQKYKLLLYGAAFYASTADGDTQYNPQTKLLQSESPITIANIEGAAGELENATMISCSPENTTPIETLNDLTIKFDYKEGYNMSVAEGATAYLRETGEEDIPATSITVDENDGTAVKFNFNNAKLYNGHTYSVVIPENSVYPVDPTTSQLLTDKGNKEITLSGYQGASYNYIGLAKRTGVYPKDGSEISYLSKVELNFDFGDTGYSISRQSKPEVKLYEGERNAEKLIGTYTCDQGTTTAQIWKFDLKPGSTYLFVMEKNTLQISKKRPGSDGYMSVPEYTNEEVVVTYTTPAELTPVDKIKFQSSVPAENAEVEKLEDVTLTFAPYLFEENQFAPVATDQEMKATFSEVGQGGNVPPTQEVTLGISLDQQGTVYVAKGTVGRTLYEGKTYRLVVPAGAFRPNETRLPASTANDEYVLTLKGKASHYQLAGTSSITADANMASLGVAAFYFNNDVAVTAEAKAKLYKADGEEALAEAPVRAVTGMPAAVYADFCDENHAPYALEAGAAYRLELPQGSVTSQADAEMMNQAVSVTFGGPAVTEYVTLSYITDNATTKTQVVKGNATACTFSLEADWSIGSLLFNDTEVSDQIASNPSTYTTPALDADATLKVTLKYTGSTYTEGPGTGVITPEGTSLKAYSDDGNVVVEGLTANTDVVTVYSMGGAVLQHFTATDKVATITLPADTYYLVKVNTIMMKILNK